MTKCACGLQELPLAPVRTGSSVRKSDFTLVGVRWRNHSLLHCEESWELRVP